MAAFHLFGHFAGGPEIRLFWDPPVVDLAVASAQDDFQGGLLLLDHLPDRAAHNADFFAEKLPVILAVSFAE